MAATSPLASAAAAVGIKEEQRFNFGRLANYPQSRRQAKKKNPNRHSLLLPHFYHLNNNYWLPLCWFTLFVEHKARSFCLLKVTTSPAFVQRK